MLAWEQYGIAVHPYATHSQPLTAAKYLVKEARKTQPNAVFVININTLGFDMENHALHRLFDYMPLSANKVQCLEEIADIYDLTLSEKAELYFPILRYHSRWTDVKAIDFSTSGIEYKGAYNYTAYLRNHINLSERYGTRDEEVEPPEHIMKSINELLDYCDAEKLKVLFVTVPRREDSWNESRMFNYINRHLEERGYPTLDLTHKLDEMQIDLKKDYYNRTHTNIHGAAKITRYIAEHLIEKFGFKNKKSDPAYNDWNETYTEYLKLVSPWALDFEFEGAARDNTVHAPALKAAFADGTATITWTRVRNGEQYAVFKKVGTEGYWTRLGVTDQAYYVDPTCKKDGSYQYVVVPFYQKDGEPVYGNCDYNGILIAVENGKAAGFPETVDVNSP